MIANLNFLDPGTPLSGATLEEVSADLRSVKELLKGLLLVSHTANGNLKDSAVTTVAANSVTSEQLKNGAVLTVHLGNLSVTTDKIALGAVTADQIANGSITADKLASGVLTTTHFAENTIPLSALNAVITGEYISSSAVDNTLRAITTNHIANLAVTDRCIGSVNINKLLPSDNNKLLFCNGTNWIAVALGGGLIYNSASGLFETNTGLKAALFGQSVTLGTGGGAGVTATWTARLLSEASDPDDIMTFASGKFKLPLGVYFLRIEAAAYGVGRHQLRLTNTGDDIPTIYGSTEVAHTSTQTNASLLAQFEVLDETDEFTLEHWVETASNSNDFGKASTGVTPETGQVDRFVNGFIIKIS